MNKNINRTQSPTTSKKASIFSNDRKKQFQTEKKQKYSNSFYPKEKNQEQNDEKASSSMFLNSEISPRREKFSKELNDSFEYINNKKQNFQNTQDDKSLLQEVILNKENEINQLNQKIKKINIYMKSQKIKKDLIEKELEAARNKNNSLKDELNEKDEIIKELYNEIQKSNERTVGANNELKKVTDLYQNMENSFGGQIKLIQDKMKKLQFDSHQKFQELQTRNDNLQKENQELKKLIKGNHDDQSNIDNMLARNKFNSPQIKLDSARSCQLNQINSLQNENKLLKDENHNLNLKIENQSYEIDKIYKQIENYEIIIKENSEYINNLRIENEELTCRINKYQNQSDIAISETQKIEKANEKLKQEMHVQQYSFEKENKKLPKQLSNLQNNLFVNESLLTQIAELQADQNNLDNSPINHTEHSLLQTDASISNSQMNNNQFSKNKSSHIDLNSQTNDSLVREFFMLKRQNEELKRVIDQIHTNSFSSFSIFRMNENQQINDTNQYSTAIDNDILIKNQQKIQNNSQFIDSQEMLSNNESVLKIMEENKELKKSISHLNSQLEEAKSLIIENEQLKKGIEELKFQQNISKIPFVSEDSYNAQTTNSNFDSFNENKNNISNTQNKNVKSPQSTTNTASPIKQNTINNAQEGNLSQIFVLRIEEEEEEEEERSSEEYVIEYNDGQGIRNVILNNSNKSLLKSSKNDMNKNKFDDSLSIPSLNSGSNIDTELNQPNSNTGSIKDQMSSSENESGEIIDEDDNIEIRHSESALEGQLSEGEVISTDYSDNILSMKYEKAKEENQNLKDKIESMQGEIEELSAHLQDVITMQLHSTIEELDEVRASNQELKQRSLNLELLQEENSFLRHRVMSLESRESELQHFLELQGSNDSKNRLIQELINENSNLKRTISDLDNDSKNSPVNNTIDEAEKLKEEDIKAVIKTINGAVEMLDEEDEEDYDSEIDEEMDLNDHSENHMKKDSRQSESPLLDYKIIKKENEELKEMLNKLDFGNLNSGNQLGYSNTQLMNRIRDLENNITSTRSQIEILEETNADLLQRIDEFSNHESQIVDKYEEENYLLRLEIDKLKEQQQKNETNNDATWGNVSKAFQTFKNQISGLQESLVEMQRELTTDETEKDENIEDQAKQISIFSEMLGQIKDETKNLCERVDNAMLSFKYKLLKKQIKQVRNEQSEPENDQEEEDDAVI